MQILDFFKPYVQKFRGVALIVSGLFVGVVAQILLTSAKDQPEFWDPNTWISNFSKNSSPMLGLFFYILAGILFIIGLRILGEMQPGLLISKHLEQPYQPKFGFWITSLGLTILTALYTATSTGMTPALGFGIVMCFSIILFALSVITSEEWVPPKMGFVQNWLIKHKFELLALSILIIFSFFVRFWDLSLHPYSFINDEGQMGKNGACLVNGTCITIMETGWSQQPMIAFLPTGLSVFFFGNTALAVRLVSVIIGTLAVLATYLFTREAFDQITAWVAAALLATLPVHVHFSRIGVDNIVDSLSTTLIMWLLFRGIRRGSIIYFLAAGLLGGLCFYTYPGSRLAPLIGFFALCYLGFRNRGLFQSYKRRFFIFILAMGITVGPILGFFFSHPESFSARMNSEGIFQNNIFQEQVSGTGKSAIDILAYQFFKSSLVFISTDAQSNFFNSTKPFLMPLAAIFFMMGLAYTFYRLKDARFMGLFVWFWAAIILGSTITGGPPTSQRMMMSMPALCIITALGIVKSTQALFPTNKFTRWITPLLLFFFILFIGYQNITFYFIEYRTGHFFEDPTNELTYETAAFISPLHNSGRFYLISEPDVPYLSFANFEYFSPDVEKNYLPSVSPQTLAALPTDKDILFIATPSRVEDISQIARLIPNGKWSEIRRRYQPENILFFSYKIDKQQLISFKP